MYNDKKERSKLPTDLGHSYSLSRAASKNEKMKRINTSQERNKEQHETGSTCVQNRRKENVKRQQVLPVDLNNSSIVNKIGGTGKSSITKKTYSEESAKKSSTLSKSDTSEYKMCNSLKTSSWMNRPKENKIKSNLPTAIHELHHRSSYGKDNSIDGNAGVFLRPYLPSGGSSNVSCSTSKNSINTEYDKLKMERAKEMEPLLREMLNLDRLHLMNAKTSKKIKREEKRMTDDCGRVHDELAQRQKEIRRNDVTRRRTRLVSQKSISTHDLTANLGHNYHLKGIAKINEKKDKGYLSPRLSDRSSAKDDSQIFLCVTFLVNNARIYM